MPNPIIQNYLNDESIPPNKRQNVVNDLNGGKSEMDIVKGITSIYGNAYNPQSRSNFNGSEMSVQEFMAQKEANPQFRIKTGRSEYRSGGTDAFKSEDYINRDKKLTRRIGNFLGATKDAYVRGSQNIDLGRTMGEGAKENIDQLLEYQKRAEEKLASGEYTQEQYDETMRYTEEAMKEANDRRTQGLGKMTRGYVESIGAPFEGAVVGGFKPETEAAMAFLGEKISNSEDASAIVGKIDEIAKNHPAATDFLMAALELAGLKGGGKVLKKGGEATIGAVDKASDAFQSGLKKYGPQFKETLKNAPDAIKKGVDKVKGSIKAPNIISKGSKNLGKAEDLLRPLPTASNLRKAASEGRAVLGEKGFLKGTKDNIELSPRMKEAAGTLEKYFPKLRKETTASLPIKIESKISEIAAPVRESFKKVEIPGIKKKLIDSWEKVKNKQLLDHNADKWLKSIHKTFEKDYVDGLFKKFKNPDGTFRKKNLDDLWHGTINFTKRYQKIIQAVENGSTDPKILTQFDAIMQQRKILRDMIDEAAATIEDVNVSLAFKEMSDLYSAQTQLLKNIKRTNASGSSVVGGAVKNVVKKYGPVGILGAAVLKD